MEMKERMVGITAKIFRYFDIKFNNFAWYFVIGFYLKARFLKVIAKTDSRLLIYKLDISKPNILSIMLLTTQILSFMQNLHFCLIFSHDYLSLY